MNNLARVYYVVTFPGRRLPPVSYCGHNAKRDAQRFALLTAGTVRRMNGAAWERMAEDWRVGAAGR